MARAKPDERLRNLRTAARQFRRQGYEVIECPRGEQLPPFLRGFSPDLIAMRDDGNVVLEAKRRDELKGSNDFVALARVIDEQSGWRLDLIHLPSRRAAAVGADKANLDRLAERSLAVREAGLEDAALIYALSVLEGLIRDIGAQHRIRVDHLSTRAIVRDLAFIGVVDDAAVDVLDRAWDQRDRIMRGEDVAAIGEAGAVLELIEACREVQEAIALEAA